MRPALLAHGLPFTAPLNPDLPSYHSHDHKKVLCHHKDTWSQNVDINKDGRRITASFRCTKTKPRHRGRQRSRDLCSFPPRRWRGSWDPGSPQLIASYEQTCKKSTRSSGSALILGSAAKITIFIINLMCMFIMLLYKTRRIFVSVHKLLDLVKNDLEKRRRPSLSDRRKS